MKARLGRTNNERLHWIQAAMLAAILLLSAVAAPHPAWAEPSVAEGSPTGSVVSPSSPSLNSPSSSPGLAAKDAKSVLFDSLRSGKRINAEALPMVQASAAVPTVYLTFDDGPSKLTPQVLDILRKEEVMASFFVLGNQAEARSKYIKQAVSDGHSIGNHTYNHVYKELYGSFDQFWKQVEKTDGILRQITGEDNPLLRAPGGTYSNFDAFYYYLLDSAGYRLYDWNVDSGDARRRAVPAAEIVANVKAAPLKNQLVVLLHDGSGHAETVKALPQIIAYYKAKGYAFKALKPDTPTVQFPLGASKWKRSMAYSDFTRLLAQAEQKRQLSRQFQLADNTKTDKEPAVQVAVAKGTAGKSPAAVIEAAAKSLDTSKSATTAATTTTAAKAALLHETALSKHAASPQAELPKTLKVIINGTPWVLREGQFSLSDGRFVVPAAELARRFAGVVNGSGAEGRMNAAVGWASVGIDTQWHTVSIEEPGRKVELHPLIGMRQEAGGIAIALRPLTELLGGRVVGYSVSGGSGVVEIDYQPKLLHLATTLSLSGV